MSRYKLVQPKAARNYVLNPSAEVAGNFSQYGGATVTREQGISAWGEYSYKIVPGGTARGLTLLCSAAPASDPAQVIFAARGVSGVLTVTSTGVATATVIQPLGGGWVLYQAVGAFTSKEVQITNSKNETWYLDGVTHTEGTRLQTYLDGDQPGCRWVGLLHGSASVRDGNTRAGGEIYDLETDLYFRVIRPLGGMGAPENILTARVVRPGGSVEVSRIGARTLILTGWLLASSLATMNARYVALGDALKPDAVPLAADGRPQPVLIQYWGDQRILQLPSVPAGGLEDYGDPAHGFNMQLGLRFDVGAPFWSDVIETAMAVTTETSGTARMVMGRIQGEWGVLGPPSQVNVYRNLGVRAIAETDVWVYFGGDFFDFDADDNNQLVRYHKEEGYWEAPYAKAPTGGLPFVNSMLVLPDGRLVIAGLIEEIDDVLVDNVAVYDETNETWAMFGDGLAGGSVRDLAFDVVTGDVYAVKATTQLYRLPFGYTTWEDFGDPAGGSLVKLAFLLTSDPQRPVWLYGGGTGLYRMAVNASPPKWETITGPTTVTALAAGNEGEIFVGGIQTQALGIVVNPDGGTPVYIVIADADTSERISALAFDRNTGWLYMSGNFTRLHTLQATACARYRAGLFYRMPIDLPLQPPTPLESYAFAVGRDETASSLPVFPWLPPRQPADIRNLYIGFSTTGTATWPGGISVLTAAVPGGAETRPIIQLTRTGGISARIVNVLNRTTGTEIVLNQQLLDGETITIDLVNLRVTSDYNGQRRVIVPKPGSKMGSFALLPTGNQIDVRVENDGATLAGVLRYVQQYHSFAAAD